MPIYSFYIFDRHCECIYIKQWHEGERPFRNPTTSSTSPQIPDRRLSAGSKVATEIPISSRHVGRLSIQDDAKLVFGVVFSLRNMVRKLSGLDDAFVSYRTGAYKLHYYETPTNLKFVMLTDIKMNNLRVVLHQIYVNLYVEYVVKNPLSPIEHQGGIGVAVELFEMGLESFVRTIQD
ncbi:Longin-like domain-containing protein [Geopyxis carbonaria]|nr:Longin-like domain-containing protein [Geopyxis carbonaria]